MILSLFEWIEKSALGTSVNESLYAFALIESVHLLALAMLGGAVLIVDMRMLGLGLKRLPVAQVAKTAQPWLVIGLIAIIATGFPLFASLAAGKYYVNGAFWWKMYFLAGAMLYTFTIRQRVAMGDEVRATSGFGKLVALVSLFLWSGVGVMGRAIGFI
jgi:hypothetical protein